MIIFEKEYDGESIVDLDRDVYECLQEDYNQIMTKIPQDEFGFQKGTFKVTIEWTL